MSNIRANRYTDPFLNSINPYIRLAFYQTLDPYCRILTRIIYDWEFLFIKSGSATIIIEDVVYEARYGDFFIFKPNKVHSITVHEEPLVQPHIHFDFMYRSCDSCEVTISFAHPEHLTADDVRVIRSDVTSMLFADFPDYIRLSNPEMMEMLLFELIFAYDNPTQHNELWLKMHFFRLLNYLFSEITMLNNRGKRRRSVRAEDIRAYLEKNPSVKITLDDLSTYFHLEKSSISRVFQEYYQTSPIHYHLLYRINRARNMIVNTNLSLSKIAELNGFNSLQNFSRAFKRMENVMPSELRASQNLETHGESS